MFIYRCLCTCQRFILHPFIVHIFSNENSVVVFDYPLVYPKGNRERTAVYLTHCQIPLLYAAAIYLCGAAIIWCLILGLFFRLQSIRLYSIAILLRPASQYGIELGENPLKPLFA